MALAKQQDTAEPIRPQSFRRLETTSWPFIFHPSDGRSKIYRRKDSLWQAGEGSSSSCHRVHLMTRLPNSGIETGEPEASETD